MHVVEAQFTSSDVCDPKERNPILLRHPLRLLLCSSTNQGHIPEPRPGPRGRKSRQASAVLCPEELTLAECRCGRSLRCILTHEVAGDRSGEHRLTHSLETVPDGTQSRLACVELRERLLDRPHDPPLFSGRRHANGNLVKRGLRQLETSGAVRVSVEVNLVQEASQVERGHAWHLSKHMRMVVHPGRPGHDVCLGCIGVKELHAIFTDEQQGLVEQRYVNPSDLTRRAVVRHFSWPPCTLPCIHWNALIVPVDHEVSQRIACPAGGEGAHAISSRVNSSRRGARRPSNTALARGYPPWAVKGSRSKSSGEIVRLVAR